MSKKFGKFLLATAAIGTVAAAAYYFMKKKNAENSFADETESKDSAKEETVDTANYVSLTPEAKEEAVEKAEDTFTPLKDTVSEVSEKEEEIVEEFFDENDFEDEAKKDKE